MEQPLEGAQALVKTLEALGVEVVFGYSGGAAIPIFDALVTTETNIRVVATRHEQGAVHMADGYARATGKPGVVIVTSGPGAGNTITGLMTAHMDSVPLIVITGQQITRMLGRDAFQEADVMNLSLPVVKHSYQIRNPEEVPSTVVEAFGVATSGRPGPVVIDLPKDVSAAACSATIPRATRLAESPPPIPEDELAAIAHVIHQAKRPLLLAGQGVLISNAGEELRKFATEQQIPIVTTLLGKGAMDETDALCLGMLGMHGTAYANFAIQETDCLINIGSRFDDRIVGDEAVFADQATICHIDIDPTEIGKIIKTDYAATCDAREALKILIRQTRPRHRQNWLKRIRQLKHDFPLTVPRTASLTQQEILHILAELTEGRAIISTDVGQHQMWAAQFCPTRSPRDWLSSGGAGTMGFGMPAALGAQFGRPDDLVISISGDGGFQMTEYELATAAIHALPVKIIILDNKYLGMVRQWQEMFYDNRESGVDLVGNPDFRKLAEAYGVKAIHINRKSAVRKQLQAALDYNDGPVVVWCEVTKTDNVFPMIPAGRSYDHMLLAPTTKALEKPVGST